MVVVIINISAKLRPSRGSQHRVKRPVSLPPDEQVCFVVHKRSRIRLYTLPVAWWSHHLQAATASATLCSTFMFRGSVLLVLRLWCFCGSACIPPPHESIPSLSLGNPSKDISHGVLQGHLSDLESGRRNTVESSAGLDDSTTSASTPAKISNTFVSGNASAQRLDSMWRCMAAGSQSQPLLQGYQVILESLPEDPK